MMIKKRRKKHLTVGILVCANLFPPVFAEDNPVLTQDTSRVVSLAGESPQKLSVDLKQAIEIALSDNPTILVAGQEIALKKEVKKEALAGLLPGVELSGSYSRTLKKQTMVMDMNGESMSIQVGTDNSYSGGVTVSLPVFAPALYRSINLTGTDIELAVEKSRSSKLDMVNQVTKAYYQLLLTQDSYEVLLKSYAQAEANFEIVNERYGLGSVSEYDKIRADVQLRSLKPNVVSTRNGVNLARLQLRILMGLNEEVEIEIEGNLKDYESEMFERGGAAAELNLINNSDLKQLDLNANLLEKNLRLQKANFMPVLAASYSYMYTSLNDNFAMAHYNWFPYSFAGLNLSIPLFKGSNFPKLRQAKIQIDQLEQTRIHTERMLYMQMSSYLDNMSASSEQVASNKEGVLQAEKGRTIAQKRYEVGKGTILELNDSEVALTQAQLTYNQSIYDYLVAKADLEKVLGRDEMITGTNK
ncbi:MAG: TolC family protein [Tannerella sp.]|jgi:outer membrane protein TolC|nr:TolC family protein [Tannerella sp.]